MIRIKIKPSIPRKRTVAVRRAGVRVITRKQLRCLNFKMKKKQMEKELAKSGKVHLIGKMI